MRKLALEQVEGEREREMLFGVCSLPLLPPSLPSFPGPACQPSLPQISHIPIWKFLIYQNIIILKLNSPARSQLEPNALSQKLRGSEERGERKEARAHTYDCSAFPELDLQGNFWLFELHLRR